MTEQIEPDSARSEPLVGDPDLPIDSMPWPATRLTYGQMQTLRQISKDVHVPIVQLLKDAVDAYLIVQEREVERENTAIPKLESERQAVVTIEEKQSPTEFSAECWYQTSLLRLLLEDLEKVLAAHPSTQCSASDAESIRACELPLRKLLEKSCHGTVGELAKKNRSRLKVFDRRVGDGIDNPAWLDLSLLQYTLEVWQRRLFQDEPSLRHRLSCEMSRDAETANVVHRIEDTKSATTPEHVFNLWLPMIEKTADHSTWPVVGSECDSLNRLRSLISAEH